MFELGARWGTGSFLAPLLAGVKPDALMGPLSLLNALSATSESQLHQLLGDIAGQLDLPLQSAASYQRDLAAVKGHADAIPSSAVTQAGPPVAPFPKLSLTAEGTPPSQVLKLSSSQRIGVIHVEYLLCDDTCIVSNDISLDGESFDVPLNYESLTKLWNTPRADRNGYDHSGPAKIALTVTVNGVVRQLMLPVRMESLMRNNTFFINVAGSKTFYSGL